jgi:hypothetical protein
MGGLTLYMPNGRKAIDVCPRCDGTGGAYATCTACGGKGSVVLTELESRILDRCRIPTPDGPCGHITLEEEGHRASQLHAVRCAQENHETILAVREEQHPEIMKPWDPEQFAWIRRNGAAILEGRLKP